MINWINIFSITINNKKMIHKLVINILLINIILLGCTSNIYSQMRGPTLQAPLSDTSTIHKGRNYALLIGINDYTHWNKLTNPLAEVLAIKSELQNFYGFKVQILKNPTKNDILMNIRNNYIKKQFNANDQLLIMFSGHGIFDHLSEIGYLVTKYSLKTIDDPIFDTYLPFPILLKNIDKIPCNHILFIADACYAGTLDERIASSRSENKIYRDILPLEYIIRKKKLKTRIYLTSGGKERVDEGVPGKYSPFARKFLEGLRSYGGRDGILTFEELLSDYMDKVRPNQPRWGRFHDDEPGSSFLFIVNYSNLGNPTNGYITNNPNPRGVNTPVIKVDNVEEFIEEIKPNRILMLTSKVYNLHEAVDINTQYIKWVPYYDDKEPTLNINNISNLTIKSTNGAKILTKHPLSDVMKYVNCKKILFENITFGHTVSGYCNGKVLNFNTSENIRIKNSVLFGTGVTGLYLSDVNNFHLIDSTIKDCSVNLLNINNSYNIYFTNSLLENTGEYSLIVIKKNSNNIKFNRCTIRNNWTTKKYKNQYLFEIDNNCNNIYLKKSNIINNKTQLFTNNINKIKLIENKFSGNTFTDYPNSLLNGNYSDK